jgi:GTP pyrophosphokinase
VLSVHKKNCPRLHATTFQREDAVDISWEQTTPIEKQQSIILAHCNREAVAEVIGSAPNQMDMLDLTRLSNHPDDMQDWELKFEVAELQGLQKILRHFEKSTLDFEFDLDF